MNGARLPRRLRIDQAGRQASSVTFAQSSSDPVWAGVLSLAGIGSDSFIYPSKRAGRTLSSGALACCAQAYPQAACGMLG